MVITALGSWWLKKKSQDAADLREERLAWIQSRKRSTEDANEAAKRSSPWLRKFAAICVLSVAFGGILLVAFFPDIPVTIIEKVPKYSFLWGLVKWGSSYEVIQANGFVLLEWVRFSVCAIVGFLFGPGFAKTK